MRTMVATMGLLQFRKRYPPSFAGHVQMLRSRGYITQELHDLLLSFRSLRNHIVHRVADVPDNAYVSVLDTGIRLLGMLRAIPREINQVAFANVPFYSDRECLNKVQDARAVILETTHPDAQQKTRRIFPSTRSYGSGQVLSWEWNSGKRWGESWYRDPQTDEISHAWSGSLEFVGRPLETIEHY